jgi:hypothetical protein
MEAENGKAYSGSSRAGKEIATQSMAPDHQAISHAARASKFGELHRRRPVGYCGDLVAVDLGDKAS